MSELRRWAAYVYRTSGPFSQGMYLGVVTLIVVGFVALCWWLVNL